MCGVVVMEGTLQVSGLCCPPVELVKELSELKVHFFQLSCGLVELSERGVVACFWSIGAVAHRLIVVVINVVNGADAVCFVGVRESICR